MSKIKTTKFCKLIPKYQYTVLQLLCRTAIALEQEKVIEGYSKEIGDLKTGIETAKQGMTTMKNELDSLKEKYDTLEQTLKDRDDTIKNNNMGKLLF